MTRRRRPFWFFAALAALVVVGLSISPAPIQTPSPPTANPNPALLDASGSAQTNAIQASPILASVSGELFTVIRVLDGDTIELNSGERVRYVGVDTPELGRAGKPAQCFASESAQIHSALVTGKRVRLEKDRSNRDRYGRLLRFVYLEDGTFVNARLVREGAARASAYRPDLSKKTEFEQLETQARAEGKGRWGTCPN